MVDEHRVAVEEEVLGQHHAASVGGVDFRTGRRAQVGAGVRGPRFAVEDAAVAEVAPVPGARDRHDEGFVPVGGRRQGRVDGADLPGLPGRPLLVFWTELHVAGRHGQFGGRKTHAQHLDRLGLLHDAPVGIGHGHFHRVIPSRRIQIDADDREPAVVVAHEGHASLRPLDGDGFKTFQVRNFELQRLTLTGAQRSHEQQGCRLHRNSPQTLPRGLFYPKWAVDSRIGREVC